MTTTTENPQQALIKLVASGKLQPSIRARLSPRVQALINAVGGGQGGGGGGGLAALLAGAGGGQGGGGGLAALLRGAGGGQGGGGGDCRSRPELYMDLVTFPGLTCASLSAGAP